MAQAAEQVLEAANRRAVVDAAHGRIVFSSKIGDRYVQRHHQSRWKASRISPRASLLAAQASTGPASTGPGVAIYGPAERLECTVLATPDGRFEIKPAASGRLVFHNAQLVLHFVPSLVSADFVYSAKADAARDRLYLPSLGMLVGLVDGEDAVLVGVWPPGRQAVSLAKGASADAALLDGLTLDMAGEPFALAFLEKPGIWHAEPLRPAYLESTRPSPGAGRWKRSGSAASSSTRRRSTGRSTFAMRR